MAGSISLSLSQQFDPLGKPYGGGKVYFIQAGTVGTPQNAYQDLGLTSPWPNPYTLLEDGRIPQVYFADGYIKIRITDKNGVQVFNQDNIPVVGPSSGGGGGGGVDPTTIIQTGWIQPIYGTGAVAGFVRCNARTLGNASSGATERANADTAALFAWLYNADPNLVVSGGRGASAAADYAANKTIALPDARCRPVAGLGDMGNSDVGLFTGVTFTSGNSTTLGSLVGAARRTLTLLQLPTGITSSGTNNITVTPNGFFVMRAGSGFILDFPSTAGSGLRAPGNTATMDNTAQFFGANPISATSNNTSGQAFDSVSPYLLATVYLKL